MNWKNSILAPTIVAILISSIFYITDLASKSSSIMIPSGAVVPFNLTKCPESWKKYHKAQGRVILGAGKGEGLSERSLGQTGGKEKHTLSSDEMAKHAHYTWHFSKIFKKGTDVSALTKNESGSQLMTAYDGEGTPHNNMQPWIALLYCEKQ